MFKLSKKTEYGILALRYISSLNGQEVATVREIAEKYKIPQSLLAKILQQLVRGEMIKSVQGSRGGYVMHKDSSRISLADVVEAIEGPIHLIGCGEKEDDCVRHDICDLKGTFAPVQEQIVEFFRSVTLDNFDIVER